MKDKPLDLVEFLILLLDALQSAGVDYMIGGAVAEWAWGEPPRDPGSGSRRQPPAGKDCCSLRRAEEKGHARPPRDYPGCIDR